MPLPRMVGFTPDRETALAEVVSSSATALLRARNACSFKKWEFFYYFDVYFARGVGNTDPLGPAYQLPIQTLAITLENMERQLANPLFELRLEELERDCAQADTVTFDKTELRGWKAEQKRLNPEHANDKAWLRQQKQALIGQLLTKASPGIAFDPRFFALPRGFSGTESRVQTFLHELSHLASGTKDFPNGYGLAGCDRIREQGADKAVKNAENISYFVAEFLNVTPARAAFAAGKPPARPTPFSRR